VEKLMGWLHAQEGNQQEIIKREKWAHSITETPKSCSSFREAPPNKPTEESLFYFRPGGNQFSFLLLRQVQNNIPIRTAIFLQTIILSHQ